MADNVSPPVLTVKSLTVCADGFLTLARITAIWSPALTASPEGKYRIAEPAASVAPLAAVPGMRRTVCQPWVVSVTRTPLTEAKPVAPVLSPKLMLLAAAAAHPAWLKQVVALNDTV